MLKFALCGGETPDVVTTGSTTAFHHLYYITFIVICQLISKIFKQPTLTIFSTNIKTASILSQFPQILYQ